MSNNVKLQVLLRAVDQASRPFKSIRTASKSLSGDIRETQKSLRELNGHASRIEGFRKTSAQLAVTGHALEKARQEAEALATQFKNTERPTRAQAKVLESAKRAAEDLQAKYNRLTDSIKRQQRELAAVGINTRNLAHDEQGLKNRISETTAQLNRQRDALARVSAQQAKLNAVKQRYQAALALISTEGATAWCAEYDEWGNLLNEENPHQLQQLIRLPGQQYDEESGLYYNRHRYYDPLQGRYITQDPIGLKGGWNFYQYPLNPISNIDPLGLETLKCIKPLHSMGGTGERSGPDIWGNPFYHQYLCVPDGKGDYTCGGQDQRGESKGDGLWGPGKASNDTKEAAGRCDLVETDNSCVENCLKGKFKEVRPRYSVLPDIFTPINLGLFKNCQDWSNDSLETCKMKCSGNNIGRFIRFVFTGVM